MKLRKIAAIAGAAAVLGLGLGACGSSGGSVALMSSWTFSAASAST